MFVKVIRGNKQITEVYEPREINFIRTDKKDFENQNPKPEEELYLKFSDGFHQSVLLFSKDEVWITSDTGKTVDRWTI